MYPEKFEDSVELVERWISILNLESLYVEQMHALVLGDERSLHIADPSQVYGLFPAQEDKNPVAVMAFSDQLHKEYD